MTSIKALLLDVGGVLMTNGWDSALRKKTAVHFSIPYDEMNSRHQLIFDTFETGKISLDEYLDKTIFYEKRDFSKEDLKTFIFNAVKPYNDMLELVCTLKKEHNLKVGIISNEGRELAEDRIRRFDLPSFVDFFVISSFVHFRKPDPDIYRLAIDVAQVPIQSVIYIDDRPLLIEVAKGLGLHGICHKSAQETNKILQSLLY